MSIEVDRTRGLEREGILSDRVRWNLPTAALFEEAESAPFSLSKGGSSKFDTLVECESARDRVNERRAKKAETAVGATTG